MTSISVTSIKRQFLDSWKILRSLQLSKSRIPSWPSGRPCEASGRPSVWEDSEQLNIDNMNIPDNRATPSERYSVFRKIMNYVVDTFGEGS
jgi:hypothetical protein